jgi:hypothetical protein
MSQMRRLGSVAVGVVASGFFCVCIWLRLFNVQPYQLEGAGILIEAAFTVTVLGALVTSCIPQLNTVVRAVAFGAFLGSLGTVSWIVFVFAPNVRW